MADTEFGWIGETRNGDIFFQDRHYRIRGDQLVSQSTFKDTQGVGILRIMRPTQLDNLDDVYNVVRVSFRTWNPGALGVLWQHPEVIVPSALSIAAGATVTVWAAYPGDFSPLGHIGVNEWTTPEPTIDYECNTNSSGDGDDHSDEVTVSVSKFSTAMKMVFENTSSVDLHFVKLQARGTPLVESDPVPVVAEDATSQQRYGTRDFPFPGEFVPSTFEAQDFADAIVSIYKSPVPVVRVPWSAVRDVDHLLKAALLDLSDRVTLNLSGASELGIVEEMFIESEQHRVEMGGTKHVVSYEMSIATDFGSFWTMGAGAIGGDTKLGY